MPTYDYKCAACEYTFEQFHSITAKPLKTCPSCKRRTLQRLIGAGGGLIFKGSGFYTTDYRSDSYKKSAEAETKSGSNGDGAGEKKDAGKESKPPAAAEKKSEAPKASESSKSAQKKKSPAPAKK